MAIKYLYIDDNLGHVVDGQVSGLNTNKDELEVVHKQPEGDWEKERDYLIKGDFSRNYDGLIIDLRLDDEVNTRREKSNYKGTTLSQELRTLSTENIVKEIPIVLLSATEKIDASLDSTGEDLFDLRIHKEKLRDEFIEISRMRLVSLAIGYSNIGDLKSETSAPAFFEKILGKNPSNVDPRFMAKINGLHKKPVHTLASFILKGLIESDGILLHEKILAARLGVGLDSKDWNNLLGVFQKAKYTGVFHQGWERWWSFEVSKILESLFGEDGLRFRNLAAEKRVNLIIEKTGLKELVPAKKLEYAQSDAFWTICLGTDNPIDPIDGLIIANQDNLFPWQEKRYVSIFEALTRKNKQKWNDISVLEIDRLTRLQKLYTRDRG